MHSMHEKEREIQVLHVIIIKDLELELSVICQNFLSSFFSIINLNLTLNYVFGIIRISISIHYLHTPNAFLLLLLI